MASLWVNLLTFATDRWLAYKCSRGIYAMTQKVRKITMYYRNDAYWGLRGPYTSRRSGYRRVYIYAENVSEAERTFYFNKLKIRNWDSRRVPVIVSPSVWDLTKPDAVVGVSLLKAHLTGVRA